MEVKPAARAGGIVDAVAHHQHLACRPCRALRHRRAWPAGWRARRRCRCRRSSATRRTAASRSPERRCTARPMSFSRGDGRGRVGAHAVLELEDDRRPGAAPEGEFEKALVFGGILHAAPGAAAEAQGFAAVFAGEPEARMLGRPRRRRRVPGRGAPPRAPGRGTAGCGWPGRGRPRGKRLRRHHERRHELRLAPRQRAGLVEDHRIDGGELFQRRAVLDHDAGAEQASAGHHLHGGNGKAQRAGAGDDEDGDGRHQRVVPAMAQQQPADQRDGGQRDARRANRSAPAGRRCGCSATGPVRPPT